MDRRVAAAIAPFLVLLVTVTALAEAGPSPPPAAEAAYRFALAKLLAAEGDLRSAGREFEQAARLAPADPYVHSEYAQALLRDAQSEATAERQRAGLQRARAEAERAVALQPRNADALRAQAQVCLAIGEQDPTALDSAIRALEALVAADPDDPGSLSTLAQIYLGRDQPGRAADLLIRAVGLRPGGRGLPPMLVDALLRAGRNAEAESFLRQQVEADPQAIRTRLALVGLLSQKGDHAGALAVLRAVPDAQQGMLEVQRQLAYELMRTGALEEALAATAPAIAAGASPGMRYLRAMIVAAMGRTAEAERELATLHQASLENVDLAIDLARLRERLDRAGDAAAALRETLQAVGQGEDRPEERGRLRFVLAAVCQRAKDWACAEDAVRPMLDAQMPAPLRNAALEREADLLAEQGRGEEALALLAGHDEEPALVAKRAEIELRAGRRAEAQAELERLAHGGDVDRQLLIAETYQRVEDYAASLPVLERARERFPDSRDVAFRLGAAYERTSRRDDALRLFRALVHEHADFAPALNYLGYMLAEKGEALGEAVDLARRAVAIEPDNGAYVDSLGWAHYQRGEYREAQAALERATQLVPDDATIREHLGDVYRAVGDLGRARQCYEQALKLGGDNAAALERKLRELPGGS